MSAVQKDKVIELLLQQGVNCYYCEHYQKCCDSDEWGCSPILNPKEELCHEWVQRKDDN
jgi:hypothetical protein